ncbi:FHA domain-containing protein [Deltaproteobacteria bacterium]|nr:FHA domain-containing protein [Deltaproteobacteria bacterium]
MPKDSEKTIRRDDVDLDAYDKEKSGFSSTLEMSRETYIGKISTTQHAFLEIMGEDKQRVLLGENEAIIGRIPDCEIQLLVENVSRKHARIIYRNEEYQVEDLGSTNGIYVNGIKVEKCILREHDIIEIGGVKILFIEEKIRQDHECK